MIYEWMLPNGVDYIRFIDEEGNAIRFSGKIDRVDAGTFILKDTHCWKPTNKTWKEIKLEIL